MNTDQSILVVFHINSEGCIMCGGEEGKDGGVKKIIMANETFRV